MRVGFSSRSFINVLNLYSGIEAKHLSKLEKKNSISSESENIVYLIYIEKRNTRP